MSRLGSMVSRILEAEETAGVGIVSQVIPPGEVRLSGRLEGVLIAGNVLPRIGERIPWLRVDKQTLVASHNIALRRPMILPAAAGREWEEVLIKDYSGSGYSLENPCHIWEDSWGNWWAAALKYITSTGYHVDFFRGDFATSPWALKDTLSEKAYVLGQGNKVFAVYRPKAGGYPMLRSRQGTIAHDGSISWSSEYNLPDDAPVIVEARHLHMIRDPNGYLWVYNAPRTGGGSGWYVNYHRYIWKSVLADSLSGGWNLDYESAVTADGRPVGFLASNGNYCILLRQRWDGSPDDTCLQETSANWGNVSNTGILGKRFRALWWPARRSLGEGGDGEWWLTYGRGGWNYMSDGLFWRNGGSANNPSWGAETTLAAAGTNYRLILPYGSGEFISAVYCTGTQLWHQDIPEDESEDFPRSYVGTFSTAYFPMGVEPRGLAGEENPLLMAEGSRLRAARMVEA